MTKLWKSLLAAPVALGTVVAFSGIAAAAESTETVSLVSVDAPVSVDALESAEPVQLAQVTSVSELSDVQPSDWAYTALQRLVEEYGCIEGYPDRTYRGNRALTRYEFAAGLNACLDVIIQLLPELPQDQLDTILRLQEEFAAELATLRGRVDTLEADVAELEANQFSTTTKLRGQLDAHLVVPFDEFFVGEDDTTFEYRARLNFDTSFTGEDRLRIRFQAGDSNGALDPFGLANGGGSGDNVTLNDVYYSFPVGSRISAIVAANSIVTDDFVTSTIVPFDGPAVADPSGPVFYDLFEGGDFAAGVNFAITDNIVLDLGYSSADGQDPTIGIFENNSYIAQLNFLSDGLIDAAVAYIGGDGGAADDAIAGLLSLDFGGFVVAGYYASVDAVGGGNLDSWQVGAAFPNFLGTGNQAGVYYTTQELAGAGDISLIEGYYELALNEFFSITPAIIYGDLDSSIAGGDADAFWGAVRTTFRF